MKLEITQGEFEDILELQTSLQAENEALEIIMQRHTEETKKLYKELALNWEDIFSKYDIPKDMIWELVAEDSKYFIKDIKPDDNCKEGEKNG